MKLLLTLLICTLVSFVYAYAQKAQPALETAKVIRVVDGDTIHVLLTDKDETVRLIGINTPELKDPDARLACLAESAKKTTATVLEGLLVKLETDPTQADRDKYGRLLRYVWPYTVDDTNYNFNLAMVQKGYAYEYTYAKPYKYQKEFRAAQKDAQDLKLTIWDQNYCIK